MKEGVNMKVKFSKNPFMFLMIAVLFLSGCATGVPQSAKRYVWPRPPDPPKIEWLKSYYGQNDFPKDGFTVFMETLVGAPPPMLFEKPIDIKSNGKGFVYVTDIAIPGIFRFDLNLQKIELWKRGSDPDRSLALTPYYISLDSSGNLYAVGTGSKNVFVVDENGTFIRKFDYATKVDAPGGILVDDSRQRIYLVDTGGSKVVVFDLEGKFMFSFGQPGEKNGEFNRPIPITMNSKKEIIVGDVMNARIQIFDGDGKFLRKFGQRGDASQDFQIIKGVAVDSDDNIYVTDGKANKVKIFNNLGQLNMSFGTAYSVPKAMMESPGGFLLPQGIFIDRTDTIYIADQANLRFQVFKYLKDAPPKESVKP